MFLLSSDTTGKEDFKLFITLIISHIMFFLLAFTVATQFSAKSGAYNYTESHKKDNVIL